MQTEAGRAVTEHMAQGEKNGPRFSCPTPVSVADLWMLTGQGQQEKLDSENLRPEHFYHSEVGVCGPFE